jgi:hypothetical protein
MWFEAGLRHKTGGMPAVRTRDSREWRINGTGICTARYIFNEDTAVASIYAEAYFSGRAAATTLTTTLTTTPATAADTSPATAAATAAATTNRVTDPDAYYSWRYSVYPCKLATLLKVWPLLDEHGVILQLPAATLAAIDSMLRMEIRAGAVRLYCASPTLRAVLDYI